MTQQYQYQDEKLEFDRTDQYLDLFYGEYLIDSILDIEDNKGNPGVYF